jgi:hypothetical protein
MAEQGAAEPGTGDQIAVEDDKGAANTEIEQLRTRVAQLEDQWRRALADLDNLRKRVARESVLNRSDERAGRGLPDRHLRDRLRLALIALGLRLRKLRERAGPARTTRRPPPPRSRTP